MTEQFPMHNYSAHSFCHLERSVSGVERSRHSRTYILAKHPRCSQPTKDETFECSPSPGVAADCRRKAPNRPDTTLSGAEGGAKGSTPRNIHRCSSKRFTPARPSRRSELLPSRFAWVHAHPTVEIPRFRFATLGMTEQCTIHNYSARSCCHVERRGARPTVETFAIAIRMGSRKYDPRDPSTALGVTERCTMAHAARTCGIPRLRLRLRSE